MQDVTNQASENGPANLIGKKNALQPVKDETRDTWNREKPRTSTVPLYHHERSRSNSFTQQISTGSFEPSSSLSALLPVTGYQHTGQVDNIDERDTNDPLCAAEYVSGMYEYFRVKERSTSVRPHFMENQPHINERMRAILADWLVEVHLKFKLVPETLYLTVNIIDRYLEKVSFLNIILFIDQRSIIAAIFMYCLLLSAIDVLGTG